MLDVQQFLACQCFVVSAVLRRATAVKLFLPIPSTRKSSRHCYTHLFQEVIWPAMFSGSSVLLAAYLFAKQIKCQLPHVEMSSLL
jgi:hypothetical protein